MTRETFYTGEHTPLANGYCRHRWANRQTREVVCNYAQGWFDGMAAERRATVKRIRERVVAEAFEKVTHPAKPALFGNAANRGKSITTLRWPSHEIEHRVRAILDEEAER